MLQLSNFGFVALWNPYMIIFSVVLLTVYYAIITMFRKDIAGSSPVPMKQQIFFILGVLILYIGKGSPVNLLGHITFSMHMVEMAIVYLIAPPLLLLGIPTWVYEGMLRIKLIKNPFLFLTKPVISILLFNGLFSFYHIPSIYDYLNTTELEHALYSFVLFFAAIFMWWPILSPLPDHQKLSDLRKIVYIFINGILLTPACALIIFADTAMYDTFSDPKQWAIMFGLCLPANSTIDMNEVIAQYFNFISPLADQQLGGVLMKVIQEIVYGTVLAYVFFRWVRKDRLNNQIDPIKTV